MIRLNYFGYFPLVYFVLFSKVIILVYLVSSMCQVSLMDYYWTPCCKCSYNFPFSLAGLIPFVVDAEFHDYHHYAGGKTRTNFGSVFTYCDYIYGTNKVISLLFLVQKVNHYYIYTRRIHNYV
jgi:sterol desaturase/sphingolipid hydroxylase (fatty acid hydroxylase superfamily)